MGHMLDNTPKNRVRGGWIAPLVSTVLTAPLGLFAVAYGGLSPMACDSCDDAEATSFGNSLENGYLVLLAGLAASAVLLILSWCLMKDESHVRRTLFALLAPVAALVALLAFSSVVQWPS